MKFLNHPLRLLALPALAGLLVGCSSGENHALAKEQVPRFRQLMAERKYEQVYGEAAEELRKATTEKDFVALLSAVDRKLGAFVSAEDNGWNVNFHTSGTFVTLGFKTKFERGDGTETLVYRVSGGKALLAGYHINSNALITN